MAHSSIIVLQLKCILEKQERMQHRTFQWTKSASKHRDTIRPLSASVGPARRVPIFRQPRTEIIWTTLLGIIPSFLIPVIRGFGSYALDGWANLLFGGLVAGFVTGAIWRQDDHQYHTKMVFKNRIDCSPTFPNRNLFASNLRRKWRHVDDVSYTILSIAIELGVSFLENRARHFSICKLFKHLVHDVRRC